MTFKRHILISGKMSCTASDELTACKECSEALDECIKCHDGHFVGADKVTCESCTANCVICGSTESCVECAADYIINSTGTKCGQPPLNCKEYEFSDVCKECNDGYVLSENQCAKCIENCISCTGKDECDECAKNYYVNDEQTCTECDVSCDGCGDKGVCTACVAGYYKDETGESMSCLKCDASCSECESALLCTSCAEGYYTTEKTNQVKCLACFPSCKTCREADRCTSCEPSTEEDAYGMCRCINLDEYFDVATKQCEPCGENCEKCSYVDNAILCEQCAVKTYWDGKECTFCKTGCTGCAETIEDDVICYECADNYILENKVCVCASGFTPDKNGNCVPCKITGCAICGSSDVCDQCEETLELTEGKCVCGENMTEENGVCACNIGYYNTEPSSCEKCDTKNCATCARINVSSNICLTCQKNYLLQENKCISLCETLDEQADKCTKCYSGNAMIDGSCKQCSQLYFRDCEKCDENACEEGCNVSCEKCSGPGESDCISCANGYFLKDQNCAECSEESEYCKCGKNIDNCVKCTSTGLECLKCKNGFALSSTGCHVKPGSNSELQQYLSIGFGALSGVLLLIIIVLAVQVSRLKKMRLLRSGKKVRADLLESQDFMRSIQTLNSMQ